MSTLVVDADFSDEILHSNKEDALYDYSSPFAMDDLYPNHINDIKDNNQDSSLESCRMSDCSSEEDDFEFSKILQPNAPPPSPQDTCMLDVMFASKLTSSLEACIKNSDSSENISSSSDASNNSCNDQEIQVVETGVMEHAQAFDKLIRISESNNNNRLKRRSCGITKNTRKSISRLPVHWQHQQSIIKMSEQAEKLKRALQKHLLDEETNLICDLKDMGL